MIKKILLLFLLFISSSAFGSDLFAKNKSSDAHFKTEISELIEGISEDRTEDFLDLLPPYQSYIAPMYHNNRAGIRCLIKLDSILGSSAKNPTDSAMIRNGMVVKKNSQSPLTKKDMAAIYKLYKKWWNKVKDSPNDMIIKSYKNNPPLMNSDYHWLVIDKCYYPVSQAK